MSKTRCFPGGLFFTSQTESVLDIHSQIRSDFFLSGPDLHSLGDSALRYVNNQIRSDLFLSGPDLLSLGDSVLRNVHNQICNDFFFITY
jgi:hypothetical protein